MADECHGSTRNRFTADQLGNSTGKGGVARDIEGIVTSVEARFTFVVHSGHVDVAAIRHIIEGRIGFEEILVGGQHSVIQLDDGKFIVSVLATHVDGDIVDEQVVHIIAVVVTEGHIFGASGQSDVSLKPSAHFASTGLCHGALRAMVTILCGTDSLFKHGGEIACA